MTSAKVTTRTKTASVRVVPTSNEAFCNDSLAHQYGGSHSSGWLSHISPSWLPYVQLICLSPPIGLISIYLPHLFGLLHAAIIQHTPLPVLIRSNTLILGGSFFLSNAIHIWNDLIDLLWRRRTCRAYTISGYWQGTCCYESVWLFPEATCRILDRVPFLRKCCLAYDL